VGPISGSKQPSKPSTTHPSDTVPTCKRNKIGDLEVVNRLLAFLLVEGTHNGENIGKIMYGIIKDSSAR
jgi:hypothetical protein